MRQDQCFDARFLRNATELLGDACYPMTPYMAQGAATAIEDAAMLARCLKAADGDDIESAFGCYEAHRKPRTTGIQAISSLPAPTRGRAKEPATRAGYMANGCNAWSAPLDKPAAHAAAV